MPTDHDRTFTERARREQIVQATVSVLATEGYRRATVSRIAEQAGVSKALVLYHFTGKDELMRQTLFRVYEQMSEDVIAELDLTQPPDRLLRNLVHVTVRRGVDKRPRRRALEQIIINEGVSETEDASSISFADKEPLYLGYEELFRRGQQDGLFRDFDVRVMAITYQGAVDAMFKYLDAHPESEPERYAASLAELLLAAVIDQHHPDAQTTAPQEPHLQQSDATMKGGSTPSPE